MGAVGWPTVSLQNRMNSESLSDFRSATGACVAAIIDHHVPLDHSQVWQTPVFGHGLEKASRVGGG